MLDCFNMKLPSNNWRGGIYWIGSVFQSTLASVNIQALPDKGEKLLKQIQVLEEALGALALSPEPGKWLCPRTQGFLEPDKETF